MRVSALVLSWILPLSLTAVPLYAATFCPWKIPSDSKTERLINLTVVQFIDVNDEEVKIAFGGGNLGSGHDIRLATKNRDDGNQLIKSMQNAAKQCDK
ncbi:hypothetical protein [uncultured Deefgea sp.]|uniref:hypothetical protein n=1 Tax=uncultured Deefgea sp. TaxID=1304914 RepID=UPI0026302E9E|nr:hypothetical protein [uncultured Deefgea sp.]